MKKTLLIALTAIMCCALTTNAAGKDKKKKTTTNTATTTVNLNNATDSLSYAAGKAFTRGLEQFLMQQFGVGEAEMPAFIKGFEDAMKIKSESELKGYAAGMSIMSMVDTRMLPGLREEFSGDSINAEMFNQGFIAHLKKDNSVLADSVAFRMYETKAKQIKEAKEMAWKKAGEDFLAENAKKEGVVTLADGLQYKVIEAGTDNGERATKEDKVTVKYEGKLIDGNVFDSSYRRKPDTTSFGVTQVIKGWTEILQLMPVGSKWEVYIPYNLAYGERGTGNGSIKPYSALIFTIELVSIDKPAAAKTEVTSETKAAAKTTKKVATKKK